MNPEDSTHTTDRIGVEAAINLAVARTNEAEARKIGEAVLLCVQAKDDREP